MKFSILIPAYKIDFFQEALLSCLEQQYQDFEIVVLDDCSPNPIQEIVEKFDDHRVRYYRNETNIGAERLVDTWNKCLELARGEYVICMGDDDKLKPNCLSEYAKLICKYPEYDVFHAHTEIINEKSEVTKILELRPEKESVFSMMYHRWKGRMQFIGDFLYKSQTLKEKGGFYYLPMAWGSDDITAYIMAGEKGIVNSQTVLFQYRISNVTLSKSGNAAIKLDAVLGDEKWMNHFLLQVPSNEDDYKYWTELKLMFFDYYDSKRRAALFSDILSNGSKRLIFWIGERNKYGVTIKQIVGSWRSAMICRFKNFCGRKV